MFQLQEGLGLPIFIAEVIKCLPICSMSECAEISSPDFIASGSLLRACKLYVADSVLDATIICFCGETPFSDMLVI